ncbi:hypothetical protein [Viscerimonas tarda]
MNKEELKASELILDLGVSIPIRPLRFLSLKTKPKKIVIRQPYTGGLVRIGRARMKIGVSHEEMKTYTVEQNMEFIAKHGQAVSEIVAMAILRGYFSYLLFHQPVAWWLRWKVHPVFLSEAMFQLIENININPFKHIINLAQAVNLMKPRLSQGANRS